MRTRLALAPEEKFLTVKEAAEIARTTAHFIYTAIKAKHLRVGHAGRGYRILHSDLLAYIAANKGSPYKQLAKDKQNAADHPVAARPRRVVAAL